MRLAFVVPGDIERRSGGYRYDRRLRDGLADRGWTIDVHKVPAAGYHRRLRTALSTELVRDLGSDRYDLLLQDELAHPNLWLLNRRLRRHGSAPIVALVHLLRWRDPTASDRLGLGRRYERRYLAGVDGYLFNSVASRRAAATLADPWPGIVAYPGRDAVNRPDSPIEPSGTSDPLHLVFVGHLTPIKGLDVLLKGLAPLDVTWQLTVVGSRRRDPAYVSSIDHLVDRLGIEEAVTFTGRLSRSDLLDRLPRTDLLALPSRYESFGLANLEAMSVGIPPLATTAGGATELVEHDRTGFLVSPDSPDAITELVADLHADRPRLARVGRAAAARAKTHPTWADTVELVDAFFGSLVQS